MKRPTTVLALALASVAGVALHYWNRGPTLRPDVSARLAEAVAKPESATIDLSAATPFAWTDLYIIPPYTTKEGAVSRMGVAWPWRWNRIQYRDGIALLVFVDSNRIAGIVEHPRGKGDFVIDGTMLHYSKANAVFTAAPRADSWVLFKPVVNAVR